MKDIRGSRSGATRRHVVPRHVLAVALVVVSLAAGLDGRLDPAVASEPTGTDSAPTEQRLLAELAGTSHDLRFERRPESGTVSFIGGSPSAPLTAPAADHGAAAEAFIDRYAPLYGLGADGDELVETRRLTDPLGGSSVRFEQRWGGVAVLGAEVAVQVAADGRVLSSLGDTIPSPGLATTPTVAATTAAETAVGAIAHERGASSASAEEPALRIYDPSLFGTGAAPEAHLAWEVALRGPLFDWLVLVDAHTGEVLWRLDRAAHARDRMVCDHANDPSLSRTTCEPSVVTRGEGDPPRGIADVDGAYDLSGAFYDFFSSRFGRDGADGYGGSLRSIVRYCDIVLCPVLTAQWMPGMTIYGDGFAKEDVVAHEFTHEFTATTSGLYYFGQPGAINESMSDVLGELVDLTDGLGNDSAAVRWRIGEGTPTGPWRNMANPLEFSHPDRMTSPFFFDGNFDNAGVHTNSGVGNKAASLITDGGTFNGQAVAGLGIDKAAYLYHLVGLAFLGPTSVYRDLGLALNQACLMLVGTLGFTSANCTNVTKAVIATEMDRAPNGAGFHPVAPSRVLDTRYSIGYTGKVGPNQSFSLQLTGPLEVTNFDPSAVVLNVTVESPTAASHLTVWPTAVPMPLASNLNFGPGQTIANLVTVQVGNEDSIEFFNNAGETHVIADVVGYYDDVYDGDELTAVTPHRLLDSRFGTGGFSTPWLAGETRNLKVTGVAGSGVPAAGVSAVVLNLTAVGPTEHSHLTVWPAGGQVPTASNLNFPPGRTIPNLVTAKVGAGGAVSIFNNSGQVHVVADVVGYYSTRPTGGRLTAITPTRLFDTRNPPLQRWGPGATRTLPVTATTGVPSAGVSAVILNVTAVSPSEPSHVTVWDTGSGMPTASNLNFFPGDVIPNLVVVKVGAGGTVSIFNNAGDVHLVIDIVGYFD